MKFRNREMTIESIVQSFNAGKISIIPSFQRRTVWKLKDRQKLVRNILRERPIPAVFLYKEQDGSKVVYNILDGKQRLETLILFVAGSRPKELKVDAAGDYFKNNPALEEMGFGVRVQNPQDALVTFRDLTSDQVARFREYPIATIEIDMHSDENPVPLNELIDLFIDINSSGKLVSRFEMVRAMKRTALFDQALKMVGRRRAHAKKSEYYKPASTDAAFVMQRLQYVSSADGYSAKVDRMWERITELVLFVNTGKHRSPAGVLKGFISAREDGVPNPDHKAMPAAKMKKLERVFEALAKAYRGFPDVPKSRLATDQPYFYTMITTLVTTDLAEEADYDFGYRLDLLAKLLIDPDMKPSLAGDVRQFMDQAKQKTTDVDRRVRRQKLFEKLFTSV